MSRHPHRSDSMGEMLKQLLFPEPIDVNSLYLLGRGALFLILLIWGWKFMFSSIASNYAGKSFLHLVNLPFHEAGHIIFMPFGRFIHTLGGTLGQLIIPTLCLGVILVKTRDAFGASVCLWWLGENFMDIAPYINDARSLRLMLIGGVTGRETIDYHDWEYILRSLGWKQWDHILAGLSQAVGILFMITALAWGGRMLWLQYKTLKERK